MSKKEGLRLKRARMKRGLSQADLAREIGVPRPSIAALETGRRNSNLIVKSIISNYFGVSFSEMWTDTPAGTDDFIEAIQTIRLDLDQAERLFKDAVTKMKKGEPST